MTMASELIRSRSSKKKGREREGESIQIETFPFYLHFSEYKKT